MRWPPRRVPVEAPPEAPVGYKLAHLLLAVDGGAICFGGLSIGAHRPYGPRAEAGCVFSARHRPPHPRCGCGFYCVHTPETARGMGVEAQHRGAVLLEVRASGRYLRYEQGLRYAHQRVAAVRIGLCGCGRSATAMVDAGDGLPGWRRLVPVCESCTGWRPVLNRRRVAALLPGVQVGPDAGARPIDTAGTHPGPRETDAAVLSAEVALLQARLDDLQARLGSPDPPGEGD